MSELKGIDYLRTKLKRKMPRVRLRYKYYEMKNAFENYSSLVPKNFKMIKPVLGWCSKAVDSVADRLVFDGFKDDNFYLDSIFDMNSRDIYFDDSILSALISSCSFTYISGDEYGDPRLQVIDGGNATGVIDPIARLLTEGYAVLDRDKDNFGEPILEAYFSPYKTQIYEKGSLVEEFETFSPYSMLVPIVNRPDTVRPFGHSRISRACMELVQQALRTQLRSEVSAEFYSFPQKYILGLSDNAEKFSKYEAMISSFLRFDKDEDGDSPTVGQFQQQSMAPYNDAMKNIASLFAGETGLTLDDLGYSTANPATPEAIAAAHETLRLTARKAQRTFGAGFLNVGFLAACTRDKREYNRAAFYQTKPRWAPLFESSASQIAGIGDAVQKIQQSFPDYFTEDKLRELTGI